MQFSILVHPWDLFDEGPEPVLDRLRGDVGVTAVTIVAAAPAMSTLRTRSVDPRVLHCDGGLLMSPDESRYDASRLRPLPASRVKARESFDAAAEAAASQGLHIRAQVSAAATGRLALRHKAAAAKNVFGSPSQFSLCLANPDVRAYLLALCADLRQRCRLAALVLTDFELRWTDAVNGRLALGAAPGPRESELLAICFCESCRQGATDAGVDIAAAARSVEALLERFLDTARPTGADFDAVLTDAPALRDYVAWGDGVLARLFEECRSAVGCEVLVGGAVRRESRGVPPAARVELLPDMERAGSALAGREAFIAAEAVNGLESSELVRGFALAAQAGCRALEVGPWGLLTESAISSLRQAIRFARRTA